MSTTGLHKNGYVYLRIPKNGSTTFRRLLEIDGWVEFNLFDSSIDLSKCFIWGHITDPYKRHTKGLSSYLYDNPDIDLENPSVQKLLASGVFDAHTYSISMTLGHLFNLPIHWIPLDTTIIDYRDNPHVELSGNDLTNAFFNEHNLGLRVTNSDIRWRGAELHRHTRDKIESIKEKYRTQFSQLSKHIIEPDLLLYNRVLDEYRNKYLPKKN